MGIVRTPSPRTQPQPRDFGFFFDRLDTCLRKGRGFSLFHADDRSVMDFAAGCEQRGLAPLTVRLSGLQDGSERPPDGSASAPFIILIQDLSYDEFVDMASLIADRLIFPFWFRRVPICFFTALGSEAYAAVRIDSEDLHRDVAHVIRALLAEQALTLLRRSNYQIASPALLEPGEQKIRFTPAEEQMQAALESHGLVCQPQVRVGRHVVDFLVQVQQSQVIVECESRGQYEASGTAERLGGYPVCRFSASEIGAGVERCIRTVQEAVRYRTLPAYVMDNDLDSSQQSAAASVSGPIRVLAPAGSGKTKTLVNRILNLLNRGVASERILALAFNKKARDEMQDRLERRGVQGVDVRTFHSFGYEIVRDGLGWTFDSGYRKAAKALIKAAIQEHTGLPPLRNRDPLDAFLAGLRKAKMELPDLSTVTVEYGDKLYPLEPIFHSYVKKQQKAGFLDFDDMIYLAVRLLLENSRLRREYQSRFEFVLVDEFQDLNEAQLLLLQIISLPENNVFAVGDDDQMIYGFRGADVKHIVEFEKRFPVASTHVLNTNYRSSRMIVRHANWLIRHNGDRVSKDIQPRKDAQPGRFEVAGHTSLLEQARHAGGWLREHKRQNSLNWRDYAILYRYNADQFAVAVMLDTLGIPHTPVATGQLFQSAVGMDVYSYLQVILFPNEARASDFARILKRPNKFFTNQLIAQAKDWDSFLRLPQIPALREWERQKLTDFITLILVFSQTRRPVDSSLSPGETSQSQRDDAQFHKAGSQSQRDPAQPQGGALQTQRDVPRPQGDAPRSRGDAPQSQRDASQSAVELLQILKTEFGLGEFYREQSRLSDDLDQASDEGLLDVMIALAGNYKTSLEFYQFLCKSIADQEGDPERDLGNGANASERDAAGSNEVYLSTIHRAKGKEFRNVVYFNLSQSAPDPKQATFIEEERRIAYVAATRPKDDLLITFPSTKPSGFLREIALNPKFREADDEELKRRVTSTQLHLERANVVLKQLEARKQDQIAFFRELTRMQPGNRPAWLKWLLDRIQLWRIDRALRRIEGSEAGIKAHREETIARLEWELHALAEEGKMRASLAAKTSPVSTLL